MKKPKPKACKVCGAKFTPYRSTDRFCSFACANLNEQKKERKPANKAHIKPFSDKRKAESLIYTKKRKVFLSEREDTFCPVALAKFDEKIPVTEIHHKKGRTGYLLNYTPYWLAVSRKGHTWIHENHSEALRLGFVIPRISD